MPRSSPQTDRVMAIINLLTARGEQGATLTEIAGVLGQSPATYVHVLASLAAGGFVVRRPADRRYHLGPGLIAPGHAAAGRFPTLGVARAAIDELARLLGYPVFVFSREGEYARLVEAVWDLRRPAPAMRIGDVLPIDPPLGSVFVAWSGQAEIDGWLDRARPTGPADRALAERLDVARAQGFVVELRPPLPLLHELGRLVRRGQQMRRAERISAAITGAEMYLAEALDPRALYDVSTLSIPVVGANGTVPIALNLVGFDEPLRGSELLRLGGAARRAADSLAEQLEGQSSAISLRRDAAGG